MDIVLAFVLLIVFSGLMMAIRIYVVRKHKFDLIIHDDKEDNEARAVHSWMREWIDRINDSNGGVDSNKCANFTFTVDTWTELPDTDNNLDELQTRLNNALLIEDYETATEIRDIINNLTVKNKPNAHS